MRRFIECCAEVEELAAFIYRELEVRADDNEPLQRLMRKLADDEDDHARQLRFALRVSPKETFAGINEAAGDPYQLKSEAEQLLNQVKAGTRNEHELLKIAVTLENRFQGIHAGYVLLFKDDSLKKLFSSLARADEKHLVDLNAYLNEYKHRRATSQSPRKGSCP
jgi:rubrerythrin